MTTKKKATSKKLPELTLEDSLRQAITLVVHEELSDQLGSKEQSLLVKAILESHEEGLEAVIRGHVFATFFDLFEEEDEEDEDEDEDDSDEGDAEDEDE